MAHILPDLSGRFPNPCPVCGADDEHAEWRETVHGSPATLCPHPREPGHGTGCCCAGRSQPFTAAGLPAPHQCMACGQSLPRFTSVSAAEKTLEDRVAVLEDDAALLARLERLWPELLRREMRRQASGTAARTRTGIPGATR